MIVLFDGVCNLCNGAVQWIIPRDPQARISFASLQSPTGHTLATQYGIDAQQLDSIVVIADNTAYTASDAILRICVTLTWPWPLLASARIVPRAWRDAIYRVVARNRYRWFGQQETCMMPTPTNAQRFLP
ncbi:MAG: thiol-disulfide oxidoreductase DCC family protein [Roseiflexaceae bacterium]|nr:thiol-disulfide oxidoreductase DCC family protein [Chloroflexaceae bacterium]MCE2852582.1 thiol-disulfide oxidoreductase DCC family protein [Chloroflexaceae bacterium]